MKVVIIGSGLSGLTAGAFLAQAHPSGTPRFRRDRPHFGRQAPITSDPYRKFMVRWGAERIGRRHEQCNTSRLQGSQADSSPAFTAVNPAYPSLNYLCYNRTHEVCSLC